ncbi:MAG: phage major capsid protein [Desulfobacteraceae bacterium]|nr:phage major capsid protein [Desulfobacteraceae bacterium]
MKTLGQYKDDIKNLMKKAADIDAQCVTENREPTEAEIALKTEIMDTVDDLQKIVNVQERQARISASLEAPTARAATVQMGVKATEMDRKERFGSFGEQMSAVVRAAVPGGQIDPRLFRAATGLNETTPSDGGFLVQTDFASGLLEQVFQTGILAPRCRRITISGNANSLKINGVDETSRASTRSGGIIGYWKNEAAQKTASKPKFRQIELSLHKLIGLCYATDELLADAGALESFIRSAFVAEFGFLLDDAIINGTGAGQPLGILNAGCLVPVAKESGQLAKTLVYENIVKMYSRMFPQSLPNAVWLINQNTQPQLFAMSMSVGTGGVPVYMPAGGISGQPYGTLFGRPVISIEQAATLGTVGDIIFADLNGYILAEKGGIESAMSIHVKFDYDESVFRFVMRVDGQPERASALTPYKGSDTLSHFVALASRA